MGDDDPYPETPIDATGLDRLMLVLKEAEESHFEKAIGLIGAAHREWELAHENGEVEEWAADDEFGAFAERINADIEEVLERNG